MKLMVIDQNPLEGKTIEHILNKYSIGISYAGQAFSYIQSLELAKLLLPNIIMINIDALEIYSSNIVCQVKQIIPGVKIILTSSNEQFNLMQAALLHDTVNYIPKPISVREYINFLKNLFLNEFNKDISGDYIRTADISYEYCTKAKDYIELYINQSRNVSLESISHELFISPFYLSRIFVESEGINFRNYVIKRKMKKAKVLLITTNQSIDDISKAVGYEDPNAFRRRFKKEIGTSASIYRKTMLNLPK